MKGRIIGQTVESKEKGNETGISGERSPQVNKRGSRREAERV